MLSNAAGEVNSLDQVGDLPLGVKADTEYHDATVQLQQSDTLLFYTDGIIEAFNRDEKEFGVNLLEAIFPQASGEPTNMLKILKAGFKKFVEGRKQEDDQTLLAVQQD